MFVSADHGYDTMTSEELLKLLVLGLLIVRVGSESAVWLLTMLHLPTRVQRTFVFVVLRLIGSSQDTGTDISPQHRSIVLGHESCLAPKYIHVGILVKVGGTLET